MYATTVKVLRVTTASSSCASFVDPHSSWLAGSALLCSALLCCHASARSSQLTLLLEAPRSAAAPKEGLVSSGQRVGCVVVCALALLALWDLAHDLVRSCGTFSQEGEREGGGQGGEGVGCGSRRKEEESGGGDERNRERADEAWGERKGEVKGRRQSCQLLHIRFCSSKPQVVPKTTPASSLRVTFEWRRRGPKAEKLDLQSRCAG